MIYELNEGKSNHSSFIIKKNSVCIAQILIVNMKTLVYLWDSITTCHSQDWNSGHCTSAHAEKKKKTYHISEADLSPSSGRTGKQNNLLWWVQKKELVSRKAIYTKYIHTTHNPDCLASQNLISLIHINANHSMTP